MAKGESLQVVDALRKAVAAWVDKGVSLSELARTAGLHSSAVIRFHAQERDLTFGNAAKLCRALGLKLVKSRG